MWHAAPGSWHLIRQVASPCNVAGGSRITCHWIRPNVRHIWILLPVSISAITTVDMSFCISVGNFIQIGPPSWSCRFSRWRISAILDFRGPIIGSLKRPRTTSYRSSIETIAALTCLVFFEKIAFIAFWRQTDRQTNRWTCSTALAVASGGLIKFVEWFVHNKTSFCTFLNRHFNFYWDMFHLSKSGFQIYVWIKIKVVRKYLNLISCTTIRMFLVRFSPSIA